jgi:DNA polymerase III epsilon subunit-like protein
MKPLLCFDIEATGPNPATDRIIELCFRATTEDGEVLGNYLVNPGRPIPQEVLDDTGYAM